MSRFVAILVTGVLLALGVAQAQPSSRLWQNVFADPPAGSILFDSVVGANGNVYNVGSVFNTPGDLRVQRINSSGAEVWRMTIPLVGQAGIAFGQVQIQVSTDGTVYVAKVVPGTDAVVVHQVLSSGTLGWTSTFTRPNEDLRRLDDFRLVDTKLYLSVVTNEEDTLPLSTTRAVLAQFDINGSFGWNQVLHATQVFTPGFMAGPTRFSNGDLGVAVSGGTASVFRVNPAGTGSIVWSTPLVTVAGRIPVVKSIETDPNDNLYIAGDYATPSPFGDNENCPMAASYSSSGALNYNFLYNPTFAPAPRTIARGFAVDRSGTAYLAIVRDLTAPVGFDQSEIIQLTAPGIPFSMSNFAGVLKDVKVDSDGNLYAVSADFENLQLRKFASNTTQLWQQTDPTRLVFLPLESVGTVRVNTGPNAEVTVAVADIAVVNNEILDAYSTLRFAPSRFFVRQVAVGADGKSRVLWEKFDGTGYILQRLSSSNSTVELQVTDTVPANFKLVGFAVGADNKARVLFRGVAGSDVGKPRIRRHTTTFGFESEFTLPAVTGTIQSIAIDSANRTWFTSFFSGVVSGFFQQTLTFRKLAAAENSVSNSFTQVLTTSVSLTFVPRGISVGQADGILRSLVTRFVSGVPTTLLQRANTTNTAITTTLTLDTDINRAGISLSTGSDNLTRTVFQSSTATVNFERAFVTQSNAIGNAVFSTFFTKAIPGGRPIHNSMSRQTGASTFGPILFAIEGGAGQVLNMNYAVPGQVNELRLEPIF